jgi:hypothetical protein
MSTTIRIAGISLGIVIVAFILTFALMVRTVSRVEDPPVVIDSLTVEPPTVCDDVLNYRSHLTWTKAPVVALVVRTIYDVDRDEIVVFDQSPRYSVVTSARTIDRLTPYYFGKELQPGNYELRLGIQTQTSAPAVATAPFVVSKNCEP